MPKASPPDAKVNGSPQAKRSKTSHNDVPKKIDWHSLEYISGFNNHCATESVPDTLPVGQNSPQNVAHGLFAEQLSGTAFTCPRATNRRSWLYRLSPSVRQGNYTPSASSAPDDGDAAFTSTFPVADPNPRRWSPLPLVPDGALVDWIDGMQTMCGAGEPSVKEGVAIHMYTCNTPMRDRAFCNADGELLLVPQLGALRVTTECGLLHVAVGEIVVLPRNLRFSVSPEEAGGACAACRGYVLEIYASRGFVLPELGPIGANGLAEPRDFLSPTAWYEDRACPNGFTITTKYCGKLFDASRDYSVYDVVAWHGNYTPYKYDLSRFHAVNTVTTDHNDPSIFTVLTCPSHEPGVAVADFVIFPPRWLCAEHTLCARPPAGRSTSTPGHSTRLRAADHGVRLCVRPCVRPCVRLWPARSRPPYFHRNVMSEFMGLVGGSYDAKAGGKDGFAPGGASLHVASTPHGPDGASYAAALAADTSVPKKFDGGLAFMFETSAMLRLTATAIQSEAVQESYRECWEGLPRASIPTE